MKNININNNIPFEYNKINYKTNTNTNTNNIYNNVESNIESNIESNNNFESNFDSDSDSDEYIDLSSNIETKSEDIYQFVIDDDKLKLTHIGKFTKAPDIIIKEKFGPDSNMNLYSCVYTYDELINKSDELFFPLVKLVVKNKSNIIITCIVIKLKKLVMIENFIDEWELYWIENKFDLEHIKICKIEKNINSTNIIEKLIGYSMNN
jgi:hypothetical protein